jgi:hypothetical protein
MFIRPPQASGTQGVAQDGRGLPTRAVGIGPPLEGGTMPGLEVLPPSPITASGESPASASRHPTPGAERATVCLYHLLMSPGPERTVDERPPVGLVRGLALGQQDGWCRRGIRIGASCNLFANGNWGWGMEPLHLGDALPMGYGFSFQ